jgi:hypothetical protein
LILGLVWQLIKLKLFGGVSVASAPEMDMLRNLGESAEAFAKLSSEQLLLRWINFHMAKWGNSGGGGGGAATVRNFDSDLKVQHSRLTD